MQLLLSYVISIHIIIFCQTYLHGPQVKLPLPISGHAGISVTHQTVFTYSQTFLLLHVHLKHEYAYTFIILNTFLRRISSFEKACGIFSVEMYFPLLSSLQSKFAH